VLRDGQTGLQGKEIVEEQGEALGAAINLADQNFGIRAGTEQALPQANLVKAHLMRQPLILRQIADKLRDQGEVGRVGRADGEGHR
jgi:hypothetical protein